MTEFGTIGVAIVLAIINLLSYVLGRYEGYELGKYDGKMEIINKNIEREKRG